MITLREGHTNWLSSAIWPALKIYTQLNTLNRLFWGYVCMHICVYNIINEYRGHGLQGEWVAA